MRKLNVFSAFDGDATGLYSLKQAGIPVGSYRASEIDKYAIQVAMKNHPEIEQVGDICKLKPEDFWDTDIIIGGSPCQGFSVAGKDKGLTTNTGVLIDSLSKYLLFKELGFGYDKSSLTYFNESCLFWEYIRMYRGIKSMNPNVIFLLENVVSAKWEFFISKELGSNPYQINSSIVLPQNRDRLYWTNIDYTPILERKTALNEIVDNAFGGAGTRGVPRKNWTGPTKEAPSYHRQNITVRKDGIANCLTKSSACRMYQTMDGDMKMLTPEHAEQLQGLPIGYTEGVSNTQRFNMMGNGWSAPIIISFFRSLKLQIESKIETIKEIHY